MSRGGRSTETLSVELGTVIAELMARLVDERVKARLAQQRPDHEWVDQSTSPLGRRAHLAAVRRGDLPGQRVGKRVLIRRTDLDAFIERRGSERSVALEPSPEPADEVGVLMERAVASRRRGHR